MKARKVKGLDRDATLATNLARIVLVRVDELFGFMPRAADPEEVVALHDLRIAAKRVRYILEVGAPLFGAYASVAGKRAKQVQDLVGEIHDCDEHMPRIRALIDELRDADAAAVLARAADGAADLDPALAVNAPHLHERRGLETFLTFLGARRRLLFARFLELWAELEEEGMRPRLTAALAQRPPVTSDSPDGNLTGLPSEVNG